MIVVTGANGQLGGLIVAELLKRIPAYEVGVSVRDIDQASALAEQGVRVRAGDFTNPSSLMEAFEGAEQVLIVSAAIRGADAAIANCAAIDAAKDVGVKRVLYTSHQAASATSEFPPQITHAATEKYLQELGIPFTALRNGFYSSTLNYYLPLAFETGRLMLPQDGPVSWTAHTDLAQAAAIAITENGTLDGITQPLTASEILDFRAICELLSETAGRNIERVVVADDEWRASAIKSGMPEGAADFTLGMFRAARDNEFAISDPTLEKVIGHPPLKVRSLLEQIVANQKVSRG